MRTKLRFWFWRIRLPRCSYYQGSCGRPAAACSSWFGLWWLPIYLCEEHVKSSIWAPTLKEAAND